MSLTFHFDPETRVADVHFDDGKANVLSTDWLRELGSFLDRAEKEEAVAVLFRGRPGMFSGGLDMKWLPTLDAARGRELVEVFSGTMLRVYGLPIPTVAAITGHAVAGGCVLASACDHRVAVDGPTRIQMNEVLAGMSMPTWAATICQDAWPVPQVNDLLLNGRAFTPSEAHALGVVHALAPDADAAVERARVAAAAMAAIGRAPYAESKRRMRAARIEHARAVLLGE